MTFKPVSLATSPGIAGQLHVCMIELELSGDDLYFKHYEAKPAAASWTT